MARTPNALVNALNGVMENSALAMEEQRHGLKLLGYARRHLHSVRRLAAADGRIDPAEQEAITEASRLVRGCEVSLALDVRDEEELRETAGTLDTYIQETSRHRKRHEPPMEAARTHTLQV